MGHAGHVAVVPFEDGLLDTVLERLLGAAAQTVGLTGLGEEEPGLSRGDHRVIVILQEIGAWLRRCGEAIYSTRITDNYNDGKIWFNASKDGKTLYAIYALPDGENLPTELSWTGNLPKGKVTVLNNGKKVKAVVKDGQVTVKLPKGLADEPVALKFSL